MGIVKVLMWLGENFTTTVFKGIVRFSENDDFKAFESVLQIGRLAGRSGVQWVFQTKSSKMTL